LSGIKRHLQRVAHWTLPPGIETIVRSSIESRRRARQLGAKERALLGQNRSLNGRERGKTCFIIATGPSIKRQALHRLAGRTCIVVSNFMVHPDYAVIRPRYYCIAPFHPPITEDQWDTWMTEIDTRTPGAEMFFGIEDRQRCLRGGRFAERPLHFLSFGGTFDELGHGGVDLSRALPAAQSVTIIALLIAIGLGAGRVCLIGCDHDWILHTNISSHFYEESEHALVRKGYAEWSGDEGNGTDLGSLCGQYVSLWNQYKAVRKIAAVANVDIVNATDGGLLDLFPRVRLEDLLNEANG
jgi:hypothetical protein